MGANNSKQTLQVKVIDDVVYYATTPFSIGIADPYGEMTVVIPRNTAIPTRKMEHYCTTAHDNHKSASVSLYQGERPKASDNKLVGTLVFDGIPPAPRCVPEIAVCLDIDAKGNLHVSAHDKSTGWKAAPQCIPCVAVVKGKLASAEEEVEDMARQAEKHKSEDEEFLKKVNVLKAMEDYTIKIRENAAAGAYSKEVRSTFKDVADKMLDEFKEKAKDFGLQGDGMIKSCAT